MSYACNLVVWNAKCAFLINDFNFSYACSDKVLMTPLPPGHPSSLALYYLNQFQTSLNLVINGTGKGGGGGGRLFVGIICSSCYHCYYWLSVFAASPPYAQHLQDLFLFCYCGHAIRSHFSLLSTVSDNVNSYRLRNRAVRSS